MRFFFLISLLPFFSLSAQKIETVQDFEDGASIKKTTMRSGSSFHSLILEGGVEIENGKVLGENKLVTLILWRIGGSRLKAELDAIESAFEKKETTKLRSSVISWDEQNQTYTVLNVRGEKLTGVDLEKSMAIRYINWIRENML